VSEQQKSSAWGIRGIVVFTCVIFAVGLLARFGVPHFVTSCCTSPTDACINNLAEIAGAANQLALDQHLTNGAPINFPTDLTPYIKLNSAGKLPECPSGGVYHLSKVGETPTCSLGTNVTPAHILPWP